MLDQVIIRTPAFEKSGDTRNLLCIHFVTLCGSAFKIYNKVTQRKTQSLRLLRKPLLYYEPI